MPIDFKDLSRYSMDYSKLEHHFLNISIFDDKNLQKKFIEEWLKVLKIQDHNITNYLSNPVNVQTHIIKSQELNETEVFKQPLIISNEEVWINFRISALKEMLKTQTSQAVALSLSAFTQPTSNILWSTENIDPNYPKNNEPIIVVPLLNGQHNYLVIDGNHRISAAVHSQESNIKAFILKEADVISWDIFSSKFDKVLYVFFNEMSHMANEKQQKKLSDSELIKKSFLWDSSFKF